MLPCGIFRIAAQLGVTDWAQRILDCICISLAKQKDFAKPAQTTNNNRNRRLPIKPNTTNETNTINKTNKTDPASLAKNK
jgi:hypothetical protein